MKSVFRWIATIDVFDRNKPASMMVAAQEKLSTMSSTNRWLHDTLAPYLGRRVLEIGCGLGGFLRVLAATQRYELLAGTEVSDEYLAAVRAVPGIDWLRHDIVSDPLAELQARRFDTVVCSNVLEHIADDRATLRRIMQVLPENGTAIILVPAFPWLFCNLDRNAGHFRRYSKSMLRELAAGAGADVRALFYFNFPGVFGWLLNGKILHKKYLSNHLLDVFDWVVPLVKPLERLTRHFAGASLILVMRQLPDAAGQRLAPRPEG